MCNKANSNTKRGQVIAPTGSGKTLIEHNAVNQSIKRGGKVHVVLAPRIALVHQLLNEFHNYKEVPWKALCVCSSQAEFEEYYEGENVDRTVNTTTNSDEIALQITRTINFDDPLVIFSTMHSAGKIAAALIKCSVEADLVVVDEAHNLTKETWSEWLTGLPSKAQLYFTATRKCNKDLSGIGRGMDNRELFGEVIYRIAPKTLIDSGRIVPPRIHLVYPNNELDLSKEELALHGPIMMVVGGALKHAEIMNGKAARIIVFCEGATEAHDMAKSQALRDALPGWYLAAVTSLGQRMAEQGSKRKAIFERFSKEERAILFHYDVISEGIDLPGTTAILPLRELGEIKIVQAIGRALRILPADRTALKNKQISIGNIEGWQKPYGWVIFPWLGSEYTEMLSRITFWVYSLRSANFNFNTEEMVVVEQAVGGTVTPEDNLSPPLEEKPKLSGLDMALFEIEKKVKTELESEEEIFKDKITPLYKVTTGLLNSWKKKVA